MFFKDELKFLEELERECAVLRGQKLVLTRKITALNELLNSDERDMYVYEHMGCKYSVLEMHKYIMDRDIISVNQRLDAVIGAINVYTNIECYEEQNELRHDVNVFSFDQEVLDLDRTMVDRESEMLGERLARLGQDVDQDVLNKLNDELEDGESELEVAKRPRLTLMNTKDSLLMQRRAADAVKKDL